MLPLLLLDTALAAGLTGMGVPVAGGGLAGPATVGAPGMFVNPAAALTPRGEAVLDLSLIRTAVTAGLDGEAVVENSSASPVPAVGITAPLPTGSIGFVAFAPFARTGSNPADSPVRFHSIDGGMLALEVDAILAGELAPNVVFGLALRGAYLRLESHKAVDTGAMIGSLSSTETDLSGYDFLEGTQTLSDPVGLGGGVALGLQATLPNRWMLAGYYRSVLWGQVQNQLTYTPSNDLTVEIQATMTTTLRLPAQAGAALLIPVGDLRLAPEIGFEGWDAWRRFESRPSDVQIGSSDPVLDEILADAGLQTEDLIGDPEVTINGTRNTVWGGMGVRYRMDGGWWLLSGLWWSPAAISDARVHAGNVDYSSVDLRLGVRRRALSLTGDLFVIPDRVVTTSAWGTDPGTASGVPPANGTYTLQGARVGVTWVPKLGR